MKKLVIVLAIITTILVINKEEKIIIPKEAIRFRVIANSNSYKDQKIKKKVVNNLNQEIRKLTTLDASLQASRRNIKQEIPSFSRVVAKTLQEQEPNQTFSIDYGMHYFPEKEYKGIVYEEGEYESLVITLGNGLGENFWCVLFPPLCLLDTEEEVEDVEYASFVKELIDKYF